MFINYMLLKEIIFTSAICPIIMLGAIMSREIIINANISEEIRIAIIENHRLIDIDINNPNRIKKKGNIFKGIVSNIEDGLNAAFVEFGEDKQAFLPLSEIRSDINQSLKKRKGSFSSKMSNILTKGQEVIIQLTKDKIGNKGAAATTYISIPGRYIVLMHSDNTGGGISRKIVNETYRREARDFLSQIEIPEGLAIIIRTAGIGATKIDLVRDFKNLCNMWEKIDRLIYKTYAPYLLYKEPNIIVRTIRDYFTNTVSLIIIDSKEEYKQALNYFKKYMPGMEQIVVYYDKFKPIFDYYGLAKEIDQIYSLQVKLNSGGYIIIEQTEALVSIDVNSGKSIYNETHEETVYKTNMEASIELARQLRIRDLGGIVIVDFIDMISYNHKRNVERQTRISMLLDKAKIKIGKISDNGLLEITRQRIRQSYRMITHVPCYTCMGTGRIRDIHGRLVNALRQTLEHLSKTHLFIDKLIIYLPIDLSNILVNKKRQYLINLSKTYHVDIYAYGDVKLSGEKIRFYEHKRQPMSFNTYKKQHKKTYNLKNIGKNINKKKHPSIGPVPVLQCKNLYVGF